MWKVHKHIYLLLDLTRQHQSEKQITQLHEFNPFKRTTGAGLERKETEKNSNMQRGAGDRIKGDKSIGAVLSPDF